MQFSDALQIWVIAVGVIATSSVFLSNLYSQPLKLLIVRGYKAWFDKIFGVRKFGHFGEMPSPVRVCLASMLMSLIITLVLCISFPILASKYLNVFDIYQLIRSSDELSLKNFRSFFILSLTPLPLILFGNAAFDYFSISKSYKIGVAMVGRQPVTIAILFSLDFILTIIFSILALYSLVFVYILFYSLVTNLPPNIVQDVVKIQNPFKHVWPISLSREKEIFGMLYPDRFATQSFWTTMLSAIWFIIFALPYSIIRVADEVQGIEGRLINKGIIGAFAVSLFSTFYWIIFIIQKF